MHPYIEYLSEDNPIDFDRARDELASIFELLGDLDETEQDPAWHAEGDVATHTRMVCEELEEAIARAETPLGRRERLITRLAALLHDVAKPLVTTRRVMPDGIERVVAPRHAERGASYISSRVHALGLAPEIALELMAQVKHHHDPKFLIIKGRPTGAFNALARRANPRMLHALEMADMRGRRCDDRDSQIDYIELFRLGCEEAGVWEGRSERERAFIEHIVDALGGALDTDQLERAIVRGLRDLETGKIFTPEEAVSRARAKQGRFCRLVLTCGPSGSGKSTWIARNYPDHAVISLDAIREELTGDAGNQKKNDKVLAAARDRLREHLRSERDVVWDATSLHRDFRDPVLSMGHDYNAHTTLVTFHVSPGECQRRNAARSRSVPRKVIAHQLEMMNWPDDAEAHRHIVVANDGAIARDTRSMWRE